MMVNVTLHDETLESKLFNLLTSNSEQVSKWSLYKVARQAARFVGVKITRFYLFLTFLFYATVLSFLIGGISFGEQNIFNALKWCCNRALLLLVAFTF